MEELLVPYNINNILITENDIKDMFNKYDIVVNVNNITLYRTALTHKSYAETEYTNYNKGKLLEIKPNNVVDLQQRCYEELEFYGDSVIKHFVTKYIIIRYDKDQGFLTKLRTKVENRKSLANFARKLGIGKFMLISKQDDDAGNRNSDKFLEDMFEAFIGALSLDNGDLICEQFLFKLLETEIDWSELLYIDTNFKDKLQRFFHQSGFHHPIYKDIGSEIIDNKRVFTVAVMFDDETSIAAQETSKKKAEQKASMLALIRFNQLNKDQIVSEFET